MKVIPLQASPNQNVNVTLEGQPVALHVYQLSTGMFIDVYVNSILIVAAVLCENLNRVVRNAYLGLVGDFVFLDQQGIDDPVYSELGSRWILVYLETADLA